MPARIAISADQREQVQTAAGIGLRDKDISQLVKLSETTMRRHCRGELDDGRARSRAKLASTAYARAMAGDTAILLFLCKTQLGWVESARHELTGANGERLMPPPQGVLVVPAMFGGDDAEATWERVVTRQQERLAGLVSADLEARQAIESASGDDDAASGGAPPYVKQSSRG